jgi:GNAT superfamily N-acetyltransferase
MAESFLNPPNVRFSTGDTDVSQSPPEGASKHGIPEGTFFAAGPDVQAMTDADAAEYAAFFKMVLGQTEHYSPEERQESYAARTEDMTREKIKNPDWILLCVRSEAGVIIGTLEAKIITDASGERYGNIKWTVVHPEFRRQHIGTLLKVYFEAEARARGCVGIITGIKDGNTVSIHMNKRLGVLPSTVMPRPHPDMQWYTKRF